MNWEQRCIRLCAAVLICAAALRLWAGGALVPVGQALENPQVASFLMYLQTGRVVRMTTDLPESPARAVPETTQPTEPTPVTFTAEDAALVSITYNCDQSPDVEGLLTEPLDGFLTGEGPKVLILHSHTTESYTKSPGESYEESSAYRTLDPGHNMIALGEIVADILTEAGIEVIHDTDLHDYPSYNGSYTEAAASTKEYLEQHPTIELILDLHRDAAETATGQMATECSVGGEDSAQLMFVMGTDTRLQHPDWERNMSLALKLQVLLEQANPGICRGLNLTKNRYNQHLGDRALLIEIGAAGNTLAEAKIAARELAQAIVELVNGSGGVT